MKMTYDPSPAPLGLFGRLLESALARLLLLVEALASRKR